MVLLADPAPGRSRCRKRNLQRDGALDTWRKRSTPSQIQRVASPNIIVSTGSDDTGFVGNDWIGRTVLIGATVRLAITEPCPRCEMITLPQADLPKDSGILRTAAQHNAVNVGVYASVINGGTIRRGDTVVLA